MYAFLQNFEFLYLLKILLEILEIFGKSWEIPHAGCKPVGSKGLINMSYIWSPV